VSKLGYWDRIYESPELERQRQRYEYSGMAAEDRAYEERRRERARQAERDREIEDARIRRIIREERNR
jgi:hypothetical protein